MRRMITLGALAAIVSFASVAWRGSQHSDLQGAWVVESWETEDGSGSQPGLFIFTSTHYSMMFVNSGEARARYAGESISEEEVVGAYASFTANTGRYSVSGNKITTRAYVAKDPNYMGDWPENANTLEFSIDGETLTLTFFGGTATLRKVEGEPAPF